MIDEKKLIEYLEARAEENRKEWEQFDDHGAFGEYCAFSSVKNYVDSMPKVGEWIPCSERLPEEEAKEFIKEHLNGIGYLYPCLLTYRSPNTEKINVVKFYYDLYQNWFVNLGEEPCEKDRCLAWQSLPEPWKGEK